MIDEIEERLLAPVDVVQHDDERGTRSERPEQHPHGPGDLLDRGHHATFAEHSMNGPGSRRIQPEVGEALLRRGAEQLLEHLDDRPVGDPVAVGETATPSDRDTVEPSEELVGQTRLPHAGGTEDREQLAGTVGLGLCEVRPGRRPQLTLSRRSSRRCAGATANSAANSHETVRLDRGRLALQLHGLHVFHNHRVADESAASPSRSGSRPAAAACSSRAATFTASPVAMRSFAYARHDLAGVDARSGARASSRIRAGSSR